MAHLDLVIYIVNNLEKIDPMLYLESNFTIHITIANYATFFLLTNNYFAVKLVKVAIRKVA